MAKTEFKIYSLLVVKNEVDIITSSLQDACRWSDRIIVIDNGSTDGTWEAVQQIAQTHPQIIPWLRYEGPFHIGLRAKAFKAFRHELKIGDWWCVRLDADEFYTGDVRAFLANVPPCYTTVKKMSTDYVLTKEDIENYTFTGEFEKDRAHITHSLPTQRRERRFMRHSALLCWFEKWRYPHPWGRVYTHYIPVDHYQYRSPQQMEKRFATRQQAKAEGCGSFSHEKGSGWKDYILTNRQLEEQRMLARIEEEFALSANVLYQGRNTLKIIGGDMVVKSFHTPRFPNSLIYGLLRASKAERSYKNALLLGDLTPEPMAYKLRRRHGLLRDSYYVCRLSDLPLTWRMIAKQSDFPHREKIARGIGVFMAKMHEKGCYSLDFSGGNILVNEDGSRVQIVDVNRMRHYAHIDMQKGCRQTRRMHLTQNDCKYLAEGYAQARGWNAEQCYNLIIRNHIPIDV